MGDIYIKVWIFCFVKIERNFFLLDVSVFYNMFSVIVEWDLDYVGLIFDDRYDVFDRRIECIVKIVLCLKERNLRIFIECFISDFWGNWRVIEKVIFLGLDVRIYVVNIVLEL